MNPCGFMRNNLEFTLMAFYLWAYMHVTILRDGFLVTG